LINDIHIGCSLGHASKNVLSYYVLIQDVMPL
jgi:hypothetical protein